MHEKLCQHRAGLPGVRRPSSIVAVIGWSLLTAGASAETIVSQVPGAGMGTGRSSQLWQDPGPNGNDLDGDAVCFEDFVLATPQSIDRIEWWGGGACELGFRIQVWRQDPGTIAYQPIAVFYYGESASPPSPQVTFDTTAAVASAGPGGTTHWVLQLSQPIVLPANTPANPRWFISVIGLTHQAYYPWNWAQGFGGSTRTFQFIRGSGPSFRVLGDGRALVIGTVAPCIGDLDGNHAVGGSDLAILLTQWGGAGSADLSGNGTVGGEDLASLLSHWGSCP